MKSKVFKSPLRYPGGKTRMIKHLAPLFPKNIKEYREPFVGGGSVFFYMYSNGLAKKFWINDLNSDLIDFYKVLKDPYVRDAMHNVLTFLKMRNDLTEIKHFFKTDKTPAGFFVRNRCSFSGTTDCGGFSKLAAQHRFTFRAINRLSTLFDPLYDAKITCNDYMFSILESGQEVFIFIDPPYDGITNLYKEGRHGFDHIRLAETLKKTKHRFLLTYNKTEQIENLYSWAKIMEFPVTYSTGRKTVELAIMNY